MAETNHEPTPDVTYKVTCLFGEMRVEEPTYLFVDNGDGTGELRGEFASMIGGNEYLKQSAGLGMRISNWQALLSASEPKPWWRRVFEHA